MPRSPTTDGRRRVLGGIGAVGLTALAGCLGGAGLPAGSSDDGADDDTADENGGPPTVDRSLSKEYPIDRLNEESMDGGPGPDGIPSIDDPAFAPADDPPTNLDGDDPVFGVEFDGEAKAYPQYTLVWHEIVNDVVGGESVAVTYCPLTGTAQGFERGSTTFGVSGRLLNSNLIMYDRAREDYWPQMLATSIRGDREGAHLEEFPVTWTSWERWHAAYPETRVLSEDTGYARNYDDDPYGTYDPAGGYYTSDSTIFEPYADVDESVLHPKAVVLGARSADGAIAVEKEALADAGVLEGSVGDVPYVIVYEPSLDTGYVYRNPEATEVSYDDGAVLVDGDRYDPDGLPLDRVLRYDAFWFAWAGYYPDTELLT